MASAKAAAISPLTILLPGTRRTSLKDMRGVIQVPHLRARLLQPFHLFLLLLLVLCLLLLLSEGAFATFLRVLIFLDDFVDFFHLKC